MYGATAHIPHMEPGSVRPQGVWPPNDWPLDKPIPADIKRWGRLIDPGQAVECVKCHKVFKREKSRESSRHCPSCLGWLPQDECSHHWEGDENGMVCGGCGTLREEWEDYSFP